MPRDYERIARNTSGRPPADAAKRHENETQEPADELLARSIHLGGTGRAVSGPPVDGQAHTADATPDRRRRSSEEDGMQATSRRKLAMGRRALEFSRAHPDQGTGTTAAVAALEERLARAAELVRLQSDGTLQERTANARKRVLRRTITRSHLSHVAGIARLAAREAPDLERRLRFSSYNGSFVVFRSEAGRIAEEAVMQRELLMKYGLDEKVLDDLDVALGGFDAAVGQADAGRRIHVTATSELRDVADEVVAIVEGMTGSIRHRYDGEPQTLQAWESATNPGHPGPVEEDDEAEPTPQPSPGGAVKSEAEPAA